MEQQNYVRKYLMMGSQDVPADKKAADLLREAIQAGITAFEYREAGENQLFGSDKLHLGTELRKICKKHDIPFIVNNDEDMFKLLNADGIHVNQDYYDLDQLKKDFPNKKVGVTISSIEQEDGGDFASADFISVGPVYEELPHTEKQTPVGLDIVKQLSDIYPTVNVLAFGGIDQKNAQETIDAGASGVAVISAITNADEPIKDVVGKL